MTRFQEVKEPKRKSETIIPKRATPGSAGYDIHLKEDIIIRPGETVSTFTDLKCQLETNEVLYIHVRSSVGINHGIMLANGTGVIDSDYYENEDNDGNIGIALHNYSDTLVKFKAGERVAQGVIHETIEDYDGSWRVTPNMFRTGGFGSTGK